MSFHPTTTSASASFDKEKPPLSQKFEVLDSRNHPRSTRMRGLYPPKITLKLFRIRTFTFKLPSFKSYVTPFGTEIGCFPILERLLFRSVVERPDSIVKVVRVVVRDADFETVGVPTNPLVRWLSIMAAIFIVARIKVCGFYSRARVPFQKIELCPFFIRRPKTFFLVSRNSQKYESHFAKNLSFCTTKQQRNTHTHTRVAYK
jgi:hypothetical protein